MEDNGIISSNNWLEEKYQSGILNLEKIAFKKGTQHKHIFRQKLRKWEKIFANHVSNMSILCKYTYSSIAEKEFD